MTQSKPTEPTEQTLADKSKPQQSTARQALALLKWAALPERRQFYLSVLFLSLAAGLDVLLPFISRELIDHYLLPRKADLAHIVMLLLASLLIGSIATWIRYLQLVRLAGLAMRSVMRLREAVYEHVMRLPMRFFDSAITGQLVSRVTNDTESVKALYVQVLFVMLDNSIVLIGTLAAMSVLDWRLLLLVVMLLPAVFIIIWLYQRLSAPAVAKARELRSDINAQMAESIGGMSLLQSHNATQRYRSRFKTTNQHQYHARIGEVRANAWLLRPALDFLNILLMVLIIHNFGLRGAANMQIGVLYAFLAYLTRVVEPLIQITMQFSQLQQSVVAAARVKILLQEPLDTPHENTSETKHQTKHQTKHSEQSSNLGNIGAGALSLRGVEFAYKPNEPVLRHLDLEIPAGAFFGIVGHTGSGKSTLLSLLLRFYQAQSGSILIDNQALASLSNDAFRADVALVPQDPFLLAASVYENIDMGRGLSQATLETAARAAKVHDFICTLEQGYQTDLGENGGRLSTGQKQLIAIARALAGQPKILFLDEATAHIDSETEQVVQRALDELRGKVTLVAIAHRLSTIRDADQIIVLNHGSIAEQGSHERLMQIENGIYQRLYLLQQLGVD